AQALGGVERLVGRAQQGLGRLSVEGVGGDPEADGQRGRGTIREVSLDVRSDPLREHVSPVLVAVRGEQRELLAAYARRAVEPPLDGPYRPPDPAQRVVARRVAELVVDSLEAIEIADDHAQRRPRASRALELDVEDLLEAA